MITINQRKQRNTEVLKRIIKIYVSTAQPVSSKLVSREIDNTLSSATIRNIMAELEESGFIEQPHTSAGRIPTDLGYRCYFDLVSESLKMEKREAERLSHEYSNRIKSMQDIIEKTSFIISSELRQAGFVMWPGISNFYLKHLELVKVKAETVLAVLVTMTNAVKNYMIKIDNDILGSELEKVSNYINRNFEEERLSDIPSGLKNILEREEDNRAIKTVKSALKIIDHIVDHDIENEMYLEGLDYFAEEPEFNNPEVSRRIFHLFSDKKKIMNIMQREMPYRGIKAYIGRENNSEELKDCSIVTSGYGFHGDTVGRIGVLGPRRMDYDHVLRTMSYLSDLITRKLGEF